jgi:ligand-binding sensor domain-containing protein
MRRASVLLCLRAFLALQPLPAQVPASRLWRPEDRALLTDLSVVTAVAATREVVYAATPNGLAVYDRAFRQWRMTVGPLDGFPRTRITAMAADPVDGTAWLAGAGRWFVWEPFGRRWSEGLLPGGATDRVVLDAQEPGRGAYFGTRAGWYFVPRGGVSATPARPPAASIGGLTGAELQRRLPALDVVRLQVERDDFLRTYRITAAALVPVTNEVILGTDGNGTFSVDPVGYRVEHYPMGVLGGVVGAVAASRGQLCAAADVRVAAVRRAITCLDENGETATVLEGARGIPALPGTAVRRLAVTEHAVWAATDAGLVRADRRRERFARLTVNDDLPSDDVAALAAVPEGVWVGTTRGLALVADTGRAPEVVRVVPLTPVLALVVRADTLWIGSTVGLLALPPLEASPRVAVGPGPLRDPIVAVVPWRGGIAVATATRFIVRSDSGWAVVDAPGPGVGTIVNVVADGDGLFIAGTNGLAWFDPVRRAWAALTSAGDVPLPVADVAATRSYLWAATPAGLVRYRRSVLVP